MPIARTSILRGPAIVTFAGATFYSKDDIVLEMSQGTFDVTTSLHGKVDERIASRAMRVRFTPAGEWESLAVLWPYGSSAIGDSIFTGSDVPLYIQTRDGKLITLKAAAVTRMPDIDLSAARTLIGPVEFTCIGADNTAWTTASSLIAVSSNAWSDVSFASTSIKTQPYSAQWGVASPWNPFESSTGFKVSFDLQLAPIETDSDGLVDMSLAGLGVTCKCTPHGISETDLITALKIQGSGNSRGRSLYTTANTLVITGTGVSVSITGAMMRAGQMAFGSQTPRIGEVEFVASRTFTDGVAQPLYSLS